MPRRGLPENAKMRHDAHYVDGLAAAAGAPIGRMISIELIDPNPQQPRCAMGDLAELMASIAEKGHPRAADRAARSATGSRSSPASAATRPPCA